jgi:hypothetical protein
LLQTCRTWAAVPSSRTAGEGFTCQTGNRERSWLGQTSQYSTKVCRSSIPEDMNWKDIRCHYRQWIDTFICLATKDLGQVTLSSQEWKHARDNFKMVAGLMHGRSHSTRSRTVGEFSKQRHKNPLRLHHETMLLSMYWTIPHKENTGHTTKDSATSAATISPFCFRFLLFASDSQLRRPRRDGPRNEWARILCFDFFHGTEMIDWQRVAGSRLAP